MNTKTLIASGIAALFLASPLVHAQDQARVISSIPVQQQVAVPRQVCNTEQVVVETRRSGAGALMGAVAGGAVGNAIGDGSGRAAATVLGLIGGAMLGNRIEGTSAPRVENQTICTQQTVYETRTVGYSVTYEYAGRQYQIQMPQDPGPTIRVQVSPVSSWRAPQQTVYLAPQVISYQFTEPRGRWHHEHGEHRNARDHRDHRDHQDRHDRHDRHDRYDKHWR